MNFRNMQDPADREQDGMRSQRIGCDVPAVRYRSSKCADRLTPAPPARATLSIRHAERCLAPTDTRKQLRPQRAKHASLNLHTTDTNLNDQQETTWTKEILRTYFAKRHQCGKPSPPIMAP